MAGKYRNLWYKVCKYGLSVLPDTLFHNYCCPVKLL